MGTNTRPGAGRPVFDIKASPTKMDEVISRQGQWCRILKATACPNKSRGQHNIRCPICHGAGELYEYQRDVRIIDEEHYLPARNDGNGHILPWWTPVRRVNRVWKHLHTVQGGSKIYGVQSFTDTEITLQVPGDGSGFPRSYEKVLLDYVYDRYETVTAEQVTSDGTTTVEIVGTGIDTQDTHDPESIKGDLTAISRVENTTRSWTYTVLGFSRQDIYLDTSQMGYVAPQVGDTIEVDYTYCPPALLAIEMFPDNRVMQMWGQDIMEGDAVATIPSYFDIGHGDLVTLLFAQARVNHVVRRGALSYDKLAMFDVVRIVEREIRDEDGNSFTYGTNFELRNYNELHWISGGPAQGKQFEVALVERPTFRVFKSGTQHNFAENKRFPLKVLLRRYQKGHLVDGMRVDR